MITRTQPPSRDDHNHESVQRHGYSPSMREIVDAVGLRSTSAVAYQLKALAEMGYLTRDAGKARTVVEKPPRLRVIENMVSVPLSGRIAAGPR